MSQTTFLLVRHGEADWNAERRVQGHSDRPLTQSGIAQARALAEQLANEPIDAVYSSDLARAHTRHGSLRMHTDCGSRLCRHFGNVTSAHGRD